MTCRNPQRLRVAGVERLEPRRLMAGHTYYVSPTGNDQAAGTSAATAWRTLAAVDAVTLGPGDTVLLQGGATFNGTLTLGAADGGTAAAPVTISSYGTGRAEIYAGAADGIDVIDTSGVAISNLNIEGSSPTNDKSQGIDLFNDRTSGGRLGNGVSIDGVDVGGFGLWGIGVGAATVTNGFDHVSVTHATLHDDDEAGLETYAGNFTVNPAPYGLAHADVYVAYVTAYDNDGNAVHLDSGNGILLGDVANSTIEHCVAHDNGRNRLGGPVGIWTYNSDHVTIQYNESYANNGGKTDGDGFDLDGGTTNALVQYNYSHDNAGSGYLLCQFAGGTAWANNVVRYNVSQNDGGRLSYAGIDLWAASNANSLGACDIYGNTIYNAKTGANAPKGIEIDVATANVHVRNNIFDVTAGGVPAYVLNAGTGLLFQGNDYWANSTATVGIKWAGTTYATLAAWRSATGQERVGSTATGLSVDPQLANPGGGGTIGPGGDLTTLAAYRPSLASPLIDAGVDLTALGLTAPATDFFGQPVPDGAAFDIGADEVDATAPTAIAVLPAVTAGASTYTFTVTYADNVAVAAASIATGDVTVTDPNGYAQAATLTSVAGSGTTITATYTVPAPGGTWDAADAGTYTVAAAANGVFDMTGNAVAAGPLGTFAVAGGSLMLASTGSAYLELSADGASLQVWTVAAPGTSASAQTVALSALTGVTVPAGTALTIDASNGSLPASVPLTFAAGATTTVTQVGTAPTLTATVPAAAKVAFAGTQTLGSLTVAAGGTAVVADPAAGGRTVLTVGTLSLAGTLDLTDNDLVVTAGGLSAVWSAAATGYAGGMWTGPGLISSTAAADPAHATGVAVVTATATTLDGVAVPVGAVLAKVASYGDTNLSGTVDIADYTRIDAGFIGHLGGWANGDFNYDGTVDGSDYTLIDNAFNAQPAAVAPAARVAAVPAARPAARPASAVTAAASITTEQLDDEAKRRKVAPV